MLILETKRLRLRTWTESDWPYLRDLLGDRVTMSHWPQPLSEADARFWFERSAQGMRDHGYARWCCELRHGDTPIGDIGVVRMQLEGQWINDLGYIIHHEHWRCGYALEATQGIVAWAIDFGLSSLVANMATDNTPSAGLAKRLGMSLVREFDNPKNANKRTNWFELEL